MKVAFSLLVASALVVTAGCSGGSAAPTLGNLAPGTASASGAPALSGSGGQPPASGGQLPASGSLARVVNLFADDSGPHDVDVYAIGGSDFAGNAVFVASVAYGAATDWFDPGFVANSSGGRTMSLSVHRKGDAKELAGMSDTSVVPGSGMTVIVQPPDTFGVGLHGTFDHHPDAKRQDIPQAPAGKALLVSSYEGLGGTSFKDTTFFASIGNFCLPGKFSDPGIEKILGHPAPQPVGNELVVEPGAQTLTIHAGPTEAGAIADCKNAPLASAPLKVAAGDRVYAFLYAPPGSSQMKVLLLPLGT